MPTEKTRQTVNPSTEEPLWDAPVSTQEDVDKAVKAAKAAWPVWRDLSQDERAEYLNKFADAIEANQQQFTELLGKEAGKPPQAAGFELFLTMALARETPKLRLKEERLEDNEDVRTESQVEEPWLTTITADGYRTLCSFGRRSWVSSPQVGAYCPKTNCSKYRSMELPIDPWCWQVIPRPPCWEHLHLETVTLLALLGLEAGRARY